MIAVSELVSVVIPAFNAERTLDETLRSVRNQTHGNLEVAVVVDGATDGTEAIAARHAAEDPRVRFVTTPNRGVVAARNTGVAMTKGAFIAPIDADDIWHPEKIARETAVMAQEGPDTGFVYSLFRMIDINGRIIASGFRNAERGALFLRSLFVNFVGNGSGILMRREAFESVGGYDSALRRLALEGTEDKLIQTMMARRWRVGATNSYLVGYRRHGATISSDTVRMLRSRRATLEILGRRWPETPRRLLVEADATVATRLGLVLTARGRPAEGLRELAGAVFRAPGASFVIIRHTAATALARLHDRLRHGELQPGASFYDVSPDDTLKPMLPQPLCARIESLKADEETFFAEGRAGTQAA